MFYINLKFSKHARAQAKERELKIPEVLSMNDLVNNSDVDRILLEYSKNYKLCLVLSRDFDVINNTATVVTVFKKRKTPKAKWRNRHGYSNKKGEKPEKPKIKTKFVRTYAKGRGFPKKRRQMEY